MMIKEDYQRMSNVDIGFDTDMIEEIGILKHRLYITIYNEEFGIRCGYVSVLQFDPDINYLQGDITYASPKCPIKTIRDYDDNQEFNEILESTRMWVGFDWLVHNRKFSHNSMTKEECVDCCRRLITNLDNA